MGARLHHHLGPSVWSMAFAKSCRSFSRVGLGGRSLVVCVMGHRRRATAAELHGGVDSTTTGQFKK